MLKSTIYTTAKVLPGNKLEIQAPSLEVGLNVEVIILVQPINLSCLSSDFSKEEQVLSLQQRLDFLKLPLVERRCILERQAETALDHYQQNSEWQELMTGDVINY